MPYYLESPIFSDVAWVIHGFGTRLVGPSPESVSTVKQIHSNLVLLADRPGLLGEGDALVTNRPGLHAAIRTADCYPILLADSAHQAVAAIHAGWRGTASGIIRKVLEKMEKEFATNPAEVQAAIGPGIGRCCYEVGDEVARQFACVGQTHLDLLTENRKQLEAVGVPARNIEALGACTFCDAERFFSYRRDKENPGRMTSFIGIRGEIKPR